MRLQARQFATIAGLTALECMREPAVLLLTLGTVVFTALMPVLFTHTLGGAQRLVMDSSLALHFVAGLVLGALAASSALSGEIRRGTAGSVLSKPVSRPLFFLAKYAGVALLLLAFSLTQVIAGLLSSRTAADDFNPDWWGGGPLLLAPVVAFAAAGLENYFTGRPFASRAYGLLLVALAGALLVSCFIPGHEAETTGFAAAIPWKFLPAGILVAMAVLVLAAIAVAVATRLAMIPTLGVCAGLFVAGLLADYLVGRYGGSLVARGLLNLLPNWQNFWAADALHAGTVPWSYLGPAMLYAMTYLAGVLGLGIFAFRQMEVR